MDSSVRVEGGDQAAFGNERCCGWWARNWKWFVPALFLGCFLALCGCCSGMFLFFFSSIESSEPYKLALERVKADTVVVERLGEPIEGIRWPLPSGNVYIEDGRGEANIEFNIEGPKGQAHVSTQARCVAGAWALVDVAVTFEDGERSFLKIDLAGQDSLGEAPKWEPPVESEPAEK